MNVLRAFEGTLTGQVLSFFLFYFPIVVMYFEKFMHLVIYYSTSRSLLLLKTDTCILGEATKLCYTVL
jgi:hypothetical protein